MSPLPEPDVGFLAVVSDLTAYLSDDVTLDDIAGRIGAWASDVRPDTESLVPTDLEATSPFVDRASIACFPDSDIAYAVTVIPTEDAHPRVAGLRAIFGEPSLVVAEPDRPMELQFVPPPLRVDWRIVLVVRAQRSGRQLDDAVVMRVLLRRDQLG